jgi:hypothetical protein
VEHLVSGLQKLLSRRAAVEACYQMFRLPKPAAFFASMYEEKKKKDIDEKRFFSSFDNEREREKSYCVIFCTAAEAVQANKLAFLLKRFVLGRKESILI